MAKSLLHVFDRQASPQKPRASGGGAQTPRDVMNYDPPSIPGWSNYGSMGPGIGGTNYGSCGTQGPKAIRGGESGSPGNKGTRHPDGLDNDDEV